ncbi:MAG TPA: CcmD family protein [Chitinophagaceae bacterium]
MSKSKFLISAIALLLLSFTCYSQTDGDKAEMADLMRSNGRIFVVVAVVIIILIGLILYLARLDRKITRLEKENK